MDIKAFVERWVDEHRDEMLRDIGTLVAVNSIRGEAAPGAPFGEGPAEALRRALDMCASYGFAVKNYDGYVGTADMNDKPAALDILAHLDIVDAGAGWDTDPFTIVEKDGCLYGRGTDDDKGPAVAALYAMRAVRESGLELKGNVRLVLGTDEECGSSDLRYYFSKEKSAPYTFSPDASFPVYNTEKGHYAPAFRKSWEEETALPRVLTIDGGFRINVLPADAKACVAGLGEDEVRAIALQMAEKLKVSVSVEDKAGCVEISVSGQDAHASTPELGNNGITALIAILCALPLADCESTKAIKSLDKLMPHGDTAGKALGIAMEDEISGALTLAFSLLTLNDTGMEGRFDSRVPICANEDNCRIAAEKSFAEEGFEVEGSMLPPHHTSADTPFVQTLLKRYEQFTGLKGECLSMGGGTYVHDIEGGVAFGTAMPGYDTNLHSANEHILIEDMLTSCKIFAMVIADMCS